MSRDRAITAPMWERIDSELTAIEAEHHVRILLAVESGSRAWRFPSVDSDYDVRFIYVHPAEAYLSIEIPDGVIVRPNDGVLDISGWDIRKTLQLLVRSNAVVLEWLSSPIRYRDTGAVAEQILTLARETCYVPALAYHYDRIARNSLGEIVSSGRSVRLKTYCYAIRPALALVWLRRNGEAPPMDLPRLLAGVTIADDLCQAISRLVDSKATADEHGMTSRLPLLDTFLTEVLAEPVERFSLTDRTAIRSQADKLFRSILRDTRPFDISVHDGE